MVDFTRFYTSPPCRPQQESGRAAHAIRYPGNLATTQIWTDMIRESYRYVAQKALESQIPVLEKPFLIPSILVHTLRKPFPVTAHHPGALAWQWTAKYSWTVSSRLPAPPLTVLRRPPGLRLSLPTFLSPSKDSPSNENWTFRTRLSRIMPTPKSLGDVVTQALTFAFVITYLVRQMEPKGLRCALNNSKKTNIKSSSVA